jgi:hypothetical protein
MIYPYDEKYGHDVIVYYEMVLFIMKTVIVIIMHERIYDEHLVIEIQQ